MGQEAGNAECQGWHHQAFPPCQGKAKGTTVFETCQALSVFSLISLKMSGLWMRMNWLESHVGRRKDSRS